MKTVNPSFEDVISKINLLVEKLKITTDGDERRVLLKEFRGLLESADEMTVDDRRFMSDTRSFPRRRS